MVHIHKSILLVEDNPDLLESYERALSADGYRVHVAHHAQEAIDVLDTFGMVHMAVVDLFLPEHNGLAILHHLQSYADWQEIPVFILSSHPPERFDTSAEYLRDLGVVKYLDKQHTTPQQLVKEAKAVIGGNTN